MVSKIKKGNYIALRSVLMWSVFAFIKMPLKDFGVFLSTVLQVLIISRQLSTCSSMLMNLFPATTPETKAKCAASTRYV